MFNADFSPYGLTYFSVSVRLGQFSPHRQVPDDKLRILAFVSSQIPTPPYTLPTLADVTVVPLQPKTTSTIDSTGSKEREEKQLEDPTSKKRPREEHEKLPDSKRARVDRVDGEVAKTESKVTTSFAVEDTASATENLIGRLVRIKYPLRSCEPSRGSLSAPVKRTPFSAKKITEEELDFLTHAVSKALEEGMVSWGEISKQMEEKFPNKAFPSYRIESYYHSHIK